MANLTVEIGGDTTKLSKALEGVNKTDPSIINYTKIIRICYNKIEEKTGGRKDVRKKHIGVIKGVWYSKIDGKQMV